MKAAAQADVDNAITELEGLQKDAEGEMGAEEALSRKIEALRASAAALRYSLMFPSLPSGRDSLPSPPRATTPQLWPSSLLPSAFLRSVCGGATLARVPLLHLRAPTSVWLRPSDSNIEVLQKSGFLSSLSHMGACRKALLPFRCHFIAVFSPAFINSFSTKTMYFRDLLHSLSS